MTTSSSPTSLSTKTSAASATTRQPSGSVTLPQGVCLGQESVKRAELEVIEGALERETVGRFREADLSGLPDPVRADFRASIAIDTPLAQSARLRMRGRIKIGRWVPFRARQVLAPQHGFLWIAHAAGLIAGSDHYALGKGAMDWRLVGLVPVMRVFCTGPGGGDVMSASGPLICEGPPGASVGWRDRQANGLARWIGAGAGHVMGLLLGWVPMGVARGCPALSGCSNLSGSAT